MRYARAHKYYVQNATPKFDTFLNEAQYTPIMEELTLSRPRTTYRKYLWDLSTLVPRATLYCHRNRTAASTDVDEGKSQCFI